MYGVADERYTPSQKEKDDLANLQHGVFARSEISQGNDLNFENTYLAFPYEKGQLLAKDMSKYAKISLKKYRS